MAKRRDGGDAALNLDSLMDTVTNVVGVLMIVLIMVSLNIAVSVNKILSDLPPVTVEEFEKLKDQLVQATPKQDPDKVVKDITSTQSTLKVVEEELKTLDTDSSIKTNLVDTDELKKQLEQRTKERDDRKVVVEGMLSELEKLKAALDVTPEYVPPPATVVKLPNPRALPKDAIIQRFLVTGDRIVYLNDEEFLKLTSENVDKAYKNLVFDGQIKDLFGEVIMVTEKGKKVPKTFLDQKKIQDLFIKQRVGSKDVKMELIGNPNSSRMQMRLMLQPGGGETLAQINDQASVFQRAMRKFKSDANTVVWFLVSKDAIGTYLTARDIADHIGVPVGWEIVNEPHFQRQLTTFEVNHTPQKPAPPPPPGSIQIKPPGIGLD